MKMVMVSDLKARLSAHLAAVRRGETVVVSDRRTPVARIVPYGTEPVGLWIDEPSRAASELLPRREVKTMRPIDVLGLLREDRDHR